MPVSVWTSTLRRTIQTAELLPFPKLRWKVCPHKVLPALRLLDKRLCTFSHTPVRMSPFTINQEFCDSLSRSARASLSAVLGASAPCAWICQPYDAFVRAASYTWLQMLDEIQAGIFDGWTYEDIEKQMPQEYAARKKDKLKYRYESCAARLHDALKQASVLTTG